MTKHTLPRTKLKQALAISEKIDSLQFQLDAILAESSMASSKTAQSRKGKLSPQARKKIMDALRAALVKPIRAKEPKEKMSKLAAKAQKRIAPIAKTFAEAKAYVFGNYGELLRRLAQ